MDPKRRPVIIQLPCMPSGTYRTSAFREVLTHPSPVLAAVAPEVDPCNPAVVSLGSRLVATMRVSPACVGLAAPQVVQSARLFCMDVTGHWQARSCHGLVVMCNPRIVRRSEEVVLREGCMSLPHLTGNVARATQVTVEGWAPATGRLLRIEADAIEARCLQHEIDHLDGLVFLDRVVDPAKDVFARRAYARDG